MTLTPVLVAAGPDTGLPWHYGDPFGEQSRLVDGHGYVDQSNRGVLRITGGDRVSWLESLASQRIPAGGSAQMLILDPHGHIEHDLHVIDDGQGLLVTVEPATVTALFSYLDRMRFLLDVSLVDVSDAFDVLWLPRREPTPHPTWLVPAEFAAAGRTDSGQDAGGDAGKYVPRRPGRLVGAEIVVPAGQRPCAGPPAGTWALQALRVAAGVPRLGADTDHRSLPHELGLIGPAVHLAKGCYRGQETVARLHNMGRPPRRLVLLHFDGALPDPGAEAVHAGRTVGVVGSVAQHYELGPIGLAVVKRATPLDTDLDVAGIAASQEPIVIG